MCGRVALVDKLTKRRSFTQTIKSTTNNVLNDNHIVDLDRAALSAPSELVWQDCLPVQNGVTAAELSV